MEVQETLKIELVGLPSLREVVGVSSHLTYDSSYILLQPLPSSLPQLYVVLGVLRVFRG